MTTGRILVQEKIAPAIIVLQVAVFVVAQHHAERGIDDFGGHAIALLVVEAGHRVPAAAVEVGEAVTRLADVLRRLAGDVTEAALAPLEAETPASRDRLGSAR